TSATPPMYVEKEWTLSTAKGSAVVEYLLDVSEAAPADDGRQGWHFHHGWDEASATDVFFNGLWDHFWRIGGLQLVTESDAGHLIARAAAPMWLLVLICLIFPTFRMLQSYRRRNRRLSPSSISCLHSGYDLRATTDRFPECGTVPEKRQ